MNNQNFAERFRIKIHSELIDIIENSADYQPEAVEAAHAELENRHLTHQQLEEAKLEQKITEEKRALKDQVYNDIEEKTSSLGSSFMDVFNPFKKEIPSGEKYIKVVLLVIALLFLYSIYSFFIDLENSRNNGLEIEPIRYVWFLFQLVLLFYTGFSLWNKKKIGWILTTFIFSFSTLSTLLLFILNFLLEIKANGDTSGLTMRPKSNDILTIIISSGLTLIMLKKMIREEYKIRKQNIYYTFAFSLFIILAMWLSLISLN